MVNAIGGKYTRAPRRPNKGRKYNSNTLKNRNNRTKRLALLSGCLSIQLAKTDTKIYNIVIPLIY